MDDTGMRERMLAGELYLANDRQVGEDSRRAQGLAHRINTIRTLPLGAGLVLLRPRRS